MAKQVWEVGKAVQVGGHWLLVTERLPPRQPGEAGRWALQTGDGSKAYEWTPFRGLKLVRGELTRVRKRPRKKAKVAKTVTAGGRPVLVPRGSLWQRLTAHFGKRVKPRPHSTITRAPGATISPKARAQ